MKKRQLFLVFFFLLTTVSYSMDLSLKEAKIIALENNKDILIERQNVEISGGNLLGKTGAYDPVLDFTISYTDSEIPTVTTFIPSGTINEKIFDINSGVSGKLPTGTFYNLFEFDVRRTDTDSPIESLSPNWSTNLGFSIGQEVLRGFNLDSNVVSVNVAKVNQEISVLELERIVSEIIFEVEREYWNVIAFTENLVLEQKAYELAEDLVRRNQIQVDIGVLPKVSLTQAESELASRKVDLINAENSLSRAIDLLKNRLSIDLNTNINLVDSPSTEEIIINEEESIEIAVTKRAELKQALKNIERNEELTRFYSNQRLPRLAIEGSLNFQGIGGDENSDRISFGDSAADIPDSFDDPSDAFSNIAELEFPTWSVLGVFSFPIFNRSARGAYVEANAELVRSTIEQRKLIDQVKLEIRNAIREITNNKRQLKATSLSVDLAVEVLQNEEEKFKVGLSTTRDILETQRDLINARLDQIRAVIRYNISLAEYERAMGTIIENNSIVLEAN